MKSIKGYFLAAGFVVLAGSLVLSSAYTSNAAPPANAQDVRVVNTSANPVPTQALGTTAIAGNVSVTNTPTVLAQQNGLWNVSISGTPSVEVGNPANAPVFVRNVDNPARHAFQGSVTFDIPDNFIGVCPTLATVPIGKRMVIQYVTARVTLPGGEKIDEIRLRTTVNGVEAFHDLNVEPTGVLNRFRVAQSVQVYADPSALVELCVSRDLAAGLAPVNSATISGYLIDMP